MALDPKLFNSIVGSHLPAAGTQTASKPNFGFCSLCWKVSAHNLQIQVFKSRSVCLKWNVHQMDSESNFPSIYITQCIISLHKHSIESAQWDCDIAQHVKFCCTATQRAQHGYFISATQLLKEPPSSLVDTMKYPIQG